MTRTIALVTAATLAALATGCAPSLDGRYRVLIDDDGSITGGDLDLYDDGNGGAIGEVSLSIDPDCVDLDGRVTLRSAGADGAYDLDMQFDLWPCGDSTYEFYPIENGYLWTASSQGEVSSFDGSAFWGSGMVDIDIYR